MIPLDRDAWRRAMGEAAALPPDDPQRIEMHAEVSRVGPWAEAEWLALLDEGERLRLELSRLATPEGLEDRLRRIPAATPVRNLLVQRRGLLLLAAASLVLALGLWSLLSPRDRPPGPLETLALLAMNDHVDSHALDVRSDDVTAVTSGLRDRIPFEIRMPELGDGMHVEGGRRCTLGSHPVCFTTWRKDGVRLTLLQVRRADFDLPTSLAPTAVTPKGAAAGKKPLDVLIWTRGEFGWALVADDSAVLRGIRPRGN